MALSIPSGVFSVYNEAVALFTRTAKLVFPERREPCPNCYLNTMGTSNRSVNIYKPGGPYPFERGMPCPYCGGKGYEAVEASEDVEVRIYYDHKSWVNVGIPINVPDGTIQTICDMTNLSSIEKCKYMIPQYDGIQNYDTSARYERDGASIPQGFKQNPTKYAVTFWNRMNG